jgi:hypothetical protein
LGNPAWILCVHSNPLHQYLSNGSKLCLRSSHNDHVQIKEARKDALTAKQQVRSRILKAWAVRHWAALLLATLLLLLVVVGVRNMFHIPGRRTPGPSATEVVLPGRHDSTPRQLWTSAAATHGTPLKRC